MGSEYVPTRFNSKRGEWEPIHQERILPYASPDYPKWLCKNSCGATYPENTHLKKCTSCGAPLVRWMHYQEKLW